MNLITNVSSVIWSKKMYSLISLHLAVVIYFKFTISSVGKALLGELSKICHKKLCSSSSYVIFPYNVALS